MQSNKNYILRGKVMADYTFNTPKIKNGSKLVIGGRIRTVDFRVDQHFNWFQKLMWKWCFGITVEDYSEK
jgi:hypothetical protein